MNNKRILSLLLIAIGIGIGIGIADPAAAEVRAVYIYTITCSTRDREPGYAYIAVGNQVYERAYAARSARLCHWNDDIKYMINTPRQRPLGG